jgi:hypothetical protein
LPVELGHVDDALAGGPGDDDLRPQDVAHGGEVLRRVGLAQRAADRAAIADDGIGDDLLGVVHDREEPPDQVGLQERRVPGERTDAEHVGLLGDVPQLGDVVDVDQPLGPGEPQLHHRQQAVPAGDDAGLGAVAFEQFEHVADAGRADVVERGRYLHGDTPLTDGPRGWSPGDPGPCPGPRSLSTSR